MMYQAKKTSFFLSLLCCVAPVFLKAQTDIKYRRSALHLVLIESENFPRKETVMKAYANAEFPEKYDNHAIDIKTFAPMAYKVTEEERKSAGVKKSFMGDLGNSALSTVTSAEIEGDGADMPLKINKFISEKKIANQLVAKWFNRQKNGAFDVSVISKRGFYNASEMEANIAKGSARGISSLSDAGEELIGNTFVVFTKLTFISNEPVAAAVRAAAKAKADKLPSLLQQGAYVALDKAYNKTKEGYSVWTTSYLYKLKWNDSIASVFYDKYWVDEKKISSDKIKAFDNANEFTMEFVGSAKSSTLVTFSLNSNRTEDQIVELATVRNVDNVYAKLQKEYDVFKPKTPLYSGDPITAKIGLKEGLEAGDKFEVLEQVQDEKTGLTKYVRKGVITVDKKSIWDNRFNAGEATEEKTSSNNLDRTTFKGGSKYYAGMLIRQIK